MKHKILGLAAALALGCGAEAGDYDYDDVEGELVVSGRAGPDDGPGLVDYDSPDAPDVPAFQDPDYIESESESEVEKWASARYHGTGPLSAGSPLCYAPNSAGQKCVFPPFKQINLITPIWNADVPGSNCASQRAYLLSQGAASGDFDNMVAAYVDGLKSINGIGTNVVVKVNDSSGTNMTLKIYCKSAPLQLGAFVQLYFPSDTNGPDLPAFGGVNPNRGIKYIASGPNTSFHEISFENVWYATVDPMQCNVAPGPARSLALVEKSRYTGTHEGLHMMGFSHFASGLMMANQPCAGLNSTIPAAFGTALGLYNGNPSGGPTITDVGLGGWGIP